MCVDLCPGRWRRPEYILGTLTFVNALRIRQAVKRGPSWDRTFALIIKLLPLDVVQFFQDFGYYKLFFFSTNSALPTTGTKIFLLNRSCGRLTPSFYRDFTLLPVPRSFIVHGENLEEDLAVSLRVVGCRHQHPQDAGPHQDEGLAAPPFTKASQCLPVIRFTLFVCLRRQTGDGELGFDEGFLHLRSRALVASGQVVHGGLWVTSLLPSRRGCRRWRRGGPCAIPPLSSSPGRW